MKINKVDGKYTIEGMPEQMFKDIVAANCHAISASSFKFLSAVDNAELDFIVDDVAERYSCRVYAEEIMEIKDGYIEVSSALRKQ